MNDACICDTMMAFFVDEATKGTDFRESETILIASRCFITCSCTDNARVKNAKNIVHATPYWVPTSVLLFV